MVEDTEETRTWRGLNQSGMDVCWKNLAGRMEEKVLDKFEVEESKSEAFRGRGAPLEWRRVRKNNKLYSPCLENTTCSVCKESRRSLRKKKRWNSSKEW